MTSSPEFVSTMRTRPSANITRLPSESNSGSAIALEVAVPSRCPEVPDPGGAVAPRGRQALPRRINAHVEHVAVVPEVPLDGSTADQIPRGHVAARTRRDDLFVAANEGNPGDEGPRVRLLKWRAEPPPVGGVEYRGGAVVAGEDDRRSRWR